MPTPSKGDREAVTARIPAEHFRKLERLVTARGITKNDFVVSLVIDALDDIDLADIEQDQSRLPISA